MNDLINIKSESDDDTDSEVSEEEITIKKSKLNEILDKIKDYSAVREREKQLITKNKQLLKALVKYQNNKL